MGEKENVDWPLSRKYFLNKILEFKRQFLEDKKLLPKYDVLYVRHILERFKYLWLLWYEYVKYTYC